MAFVVQMMVHTSGGLARNGNACWHWRRHTRKLLVPWPGLRVVQRRRSQVRVGRLVNGGPAGTMQPAGRPHARPCPAAQDNLCHRAGDTPGLRARAAGR